MINEEKKTLIEKINCKRRLLGLPDEYEIVHNKEGKPVIVQIGFKYDFGKIEVNGKILDVCNFYVGELAENISIGAKMIERIKEDCHRGNIKGIRVVALGSELTELVGMGELLRRIKPSEYIGIEIPRNRISNFGLMFYKVRCECLDLSNLYFGDCEIATDMFADCTINRIIGIDTLNTRRLRGASEMFKFSHIGSSMDLSKWNLENLIIANATFIHCEIHGKLTVNEKLYEVAKLWKYRYRRGKNKIDIHVAGISESYDE